MSAATAEVETTDYHTAGEPFRIVTAGAPAIPGADVRERRAHAAGSESVDRLRRLLCHEPRGHADMYGCFLVPPDDEGAHFGVLFWHREGYSTACGHGTIALGTWALDTGRVQGPADGLTKVVIDVPSGRVSARVNREAGRVRSVGFRNVPAYVLARGVRVEAGRRELELDVAYGGAIYACADVRAAGVSVVPKQHRELTALGRENKQALDQGEHARHPSDERLSGVYGTVLYEHLGRGPDGLRQRNVTVFADGELDRSPCGSGTSARLALLADEGALAPGELLRHESIVGTEFSGRVVERVEADGRPAVVTEVEGSAFRTGEHRFVLDPHDPLGMGFLLP